ncbi:unnamed protein product [Lota lota]
MSIETLLEAAKFLELQAQQQQKAREENELKEKLRLEQLAEHRHSSLIYTSPVHHQYDQHVHYVAKEEPRVAHRLPPQPMPITVIPVVAASHTGLPPPPPPLPANLSQPATPHFPSPPRRDPYSPQESTRAPPPVSPQPRPDPSLSSLASAATVSYPSPPSHQNHHHHPLPQLAAQHAGTQPPLPLQRYPGSIVTAPQQQQQPLLPQPGPPQAPLPTSPNSRGSPPDDGRHLDNKKRPGGAGTRDVHNKLEKNRRAHLKECFEMLKKNIPNVDEKKTSNLSVLRSALRYIQTLKRKEKEFEHEMERLAREKIATQQRLDELKNEVSQWMDVMEVDRVLRQTVQPEEDQASTSTASEGEDIDDEDGETARRMPTALPAVPPEQRKTPALTSVPPPPPIVATHPLLPQHISIQHKPPVHQTLALPKPTVLAASGVPSATAIQALIPAQTQVVTSQPCLQPTVIAHAPASHASVIQAVNHVIQAAGHKHMAHLAPSSTSGAVQLATGHRHQHHHHQHISHITVTPVAHLGPHLPTIYSQSVAVTQLNGGMPGQTAGGAAVVSKQTGAQMVAHHPQLVGQAMLNPVTMVTMPSFPQEHMAAGQEGKRGPDHTSLQDTAEADD